MRKPSRSSLDFSTLTNLLFAVRPISAASFIDNFFTASSYKTLSENFVGAGKFYLAAINGLGDDVRLSKRKGISSRRLRGFEKNKIGPVDGTDHIGGNYAASLNFQSNLPFLFPSFQSVDFNYFFDAGNVWGVDYSNSVGDSSQIRASTGFGLEWFSPIGPSTFTLAQPLSKVDTDKTQSFQFNIGTTF